MKSFRQIGILLATVITFLVFLSTGAYGIDNEQPFEAGSIILPTDSCWQPNNDPNTVPNLNNPVCDSDKNDKSLFQLYALLYTLLDVGDQYPTACKNDDGTTPLQVSLFGYCKQIPVYWIIKNQKSDPQQDDLSITGTVQVYNSASLTSATNPVYTGGPFVIKASDLTASELNAIITKFPDVKIHVSQVPFSANVEKVLIGKPPKVAVLNEGASDVLENYIRASGLFSWLGAVFQYVTAQDVLDGCLRDPVPATCKVTRRPFQMLWAPHWIIGQGWTTTNSPTQAQQTQVLKEVRDFLERGNAGFFECASIESWEGSARAARNVSPDYGGFLTGQSLVAPRIDTNGGCSDVGCPGDYLVHEDAPFWLTQCGGWTYGATGGHVHNMRPSETKSYLWLTTKATDDPNTSYDDRFLGPEMGTGRLLSRFIHDDPAKVTYSPSSPYYVYDYLVGGRINGSPTQGYVIYFPGHKYIQCNNNTTFSYPPQRTVGLQLTGPIPTSNTQLEVELVHTNCTQGVDCPKAVYDFSKDSGQVVSDNWVSLSLENVEYDTNTFRIDGITFSSVFADNTSTQLQITDLIFKIIDNSSNPVCSADLLSDDFNDGTIANKWTISNNGTFSSTVTESSGLLNFTANASTGDNIINDNYTFVYQGLMSGDFDIKVELNSISAPSPFKALGGLMVKDSSGNFAAVAVDQNGNVYFAYRDGTTSNFLSFTSGGPKWLRLRRYGQNVYAMASDNGVTWNYTSVSRLFTNLEGDTNVGIIFTSNTLNGSASFDQFISCVKISNVIDYSERVSVCAPQEPFSHVQYIPIQCSLTQQTQNNLLLQFDGDISLDNTSSTVTITLTDTSGGTISGSYDLATGTGSVTTSGNVTLDLRNASYDPSNNLLRNIKVTTTGCTKYELADAEVQYPDDGGTIKLLNIFDATTSYKICSPEMTSPASCSGAVGGGGSSEISINLKLEFVDAFNKNNLPTTVTLKLDYSCGPGCSGSISANYDLSTNTGTSSSDSYVKLDMTGVVENKNKLENIGFTNLDSSVNINITKVTVTFDGNKVKKLRDETNKTTIADFGKKGSGSPATKNVNYPVQAAPPPPGGGGTTGIYTFGPGICDYYISPYLSSCDIDWTKSNTCGIKYILNTMLALKFQIASSEFTKTQPVVKMIKTGTNKYTLYLFQGSFDYPIYRGHLKRYKLVVDPLTNSAQFKEVWDAQNAMPPAGTSGNPSSPSSSNTTRYIFTALEQSDGSYQTVGLDASNASTLMSHFGLSNTTETEVIINSIRGRTNTSVTDPDGDGEATKRLWAIEHSTPALMTNSRLVAHSYPSLQCRDMVVFAGADDGMLHAFFAGKGTSSGGDCIYSDEGTGAEIWAYVPSSLLKSITQQPFDVQYDPNDPTNYKIFEPKVSVDGSPALGDFLVNLNKGTSLPPDYKWKTYLLETAEIRNTSDENHNKGIVFAMDVTDPYDPKVLWEHIYYDTDSNKACKGTDRNCNMGQSKGVAIGAINVGNEVKPATFLTAVWATKQKENINKTGSNYNHDYCTIDPETEGTCSIQGYTNKTDCENNGGTWSPAAEPTDCVYGLGVYALDIQTGEVLWDQKLPYTWDSSYPSEGDPRDISSAPAIPALMDVDKNGTYDYLIFGDSQGRLWAINAVTGQPLAGYDPLTKNPKPIFEVPNNLVCDNTTGECTMPSNPKPAGALEPIGAPVSVSGSYIVFGTGGADFAPDDRHYHIFLLQLLVTPQNGKYYKVVKIYQTDVGEKVWAKPLITSDMKIIIATAQNYLSRETETNIAKINSTGAVRMIDLGKQTMQTIQSGIEGGVVGGIDAEAGHAFVITLNSNIYSIGSKDASSYTPPGTTTDNPYNMIWWRKL